LKPWPSDPPRRLDAAQLRKPYLRKVPVISIVDDDESVREATTGLVRSFGYVAVTFASAEEFLQSDRVRDTSCLISDVQMSGLSGVELQDRLNAAGHRVPIIFITAFPEERIRARVLKAGACGFLTKPFSDDSLFECLDTALNSQDGESSEQ
jgi:FixJ family two-component response regulator